MVQVAELSSGMAALQRWADEVDEQILVDELYSAVEGCVRSLPDYSVHFAKVETLLKQGVNPNAKACINQYGEGRYCLNRACQSPPFADTAFHEDDEYKVVDLLLSYKADPNLHDGRHNNNTRFPLLSACLRHDFKLVQKLIDAGANVNDVSKRRSLMFSDSYDGTTPLHLALNANHSRHNYGNYRAAVMKTLRVLLDAGADPNIRVSRRVLPTALHIAVHKRDKSAAILLLEYGADPTITDYESETVEKMWPKFFGSDEAKKAMKKWRHKVAKVAQKEVRVLSHILASQPRTFPAQGLPLLPIEMYRKIAEHLFAGRTVADFRGACANRALVDFGQKELGRPPDRTP